MLKYQIAYVALLGSLLAVAIVYGFFGHAKIYNFSYGDSSGNALIRAYEAPKHPMLSCSDGSDCWKLNKLFSEDWDASKPRSAIYFLAHKGRLGHLLKILQDLDTNFKYNYPIIIFHDKDMKPYLSKIINISNARIFFQEVQFEEINFLYPSPPSHPTCPSRNSLGYRNMCRFQSKTVYELPIMQGLEFYWRLDCDSRITSNISYDIFQYMRDNDLQYGYICLLRDACITNLYEVSRMFTESRDINASFFGKLKSSLVFYNNFEIAKTNFFRSTKYQNYINFIDQFGGIYYHRWGDAPIKSIAISIFIPESQTHQFYDIGYLHSGKGNRQNATKPEGWMCKYL